MSGAKRQDGLGASAGVNNTTGAPRGPTRVGVPHGATHSGGSGQGAGHQELPERIFRVVVGLRVPADAPHKLLTKATEDGLEDATGALPGKGSVRAEGALGSAQGATRRVRVSLTVSGAAAEPSWSGLAADAFAARFVATLASKGLAAERVA